MRCGFEKESDLSYADDGALIRKIWFGGNQPFSNAENSALDRQATAPWLDKELRFRSAENYALVKHR